MVQQIISTLLLSSLLSMPVWAGTLSGTIVAVYDGDTATLLVHRTQHKIRLGGIDCPERGAPHGTAARQALADLVFQKTVTVVTMGQDRYQRWLGFILLQDGQSINHHLVWAGHCWHYAEYSNDPVLGTLQAQARLAKVGLWADPDPVEPWIWRKDEKARRSKAREGK